MWTLEWLLRKVQSVLSFLIQSKNYMQVKEYTKIKIHSCKKLYSGMLFGKRETAFKVSGDYFLDLMSVKCQLIFSSGSCGSPSHTTFDTIMLKVCCFLGSNQSTLGVCAQNWRDPNRIILKSGGFCACQKFWQVAKLWTAVSPKCGHHENPCNSKLMTKFLWLRQNLGIYNRNWNLQGVFWGIFIILTLEMKESAKVWACALYDFRIQRKKIKPFGKDCVYQSKN